MKQILRLFPVAVLTLCFGVAQAQTTYKIKGVLRDADSALRLSKASVKIASTRDTTRSRIVAADGEGRFVIEPVRPGEYQIVFSYVGYDDLRRKVSITNKDLDLGEVLIARKQKTLDDVVFTSKIAPARQKGDTTEINAGALKVNPDATAEEMLRKAPGVTVEGGQVTAQGEQVRRITIDGRQYFGDDATAALRNLPAEVIDKIQVFDRLSDQGQLTGFDDGQGFKAINIVTKANMRNGQFGRIYGGYGTDQRYAAGTSMNFFKQNKRLNVIGLFNNVNQQNFGAEDLLGVSGMANMGGRGGMGGFGGRPGGGRPGGMGSFGGGSGFSVGQQPGIAQTNAVGLNFSDLWFKKKADFSASYFFNNSNTQANSDTKRETFMPGDTSQFYRQANKNESDNFNHRINARLEYRIDSNNTLIIAPNISFQKNNSFSETLGVNNTADQELINSTLNRRQSDANGFNARNELTYRRGFPAKRGRSISVNLNTSWSKRESETDLSSFNTYFKAGALFGDTILQRTDNQTDNKSISANLAYTEPISAKSQIQLNYNPQFSNNQADQRNMLYDKATGDYTKLDSTLSNVFDNKVKAQSAGITYRLGDRDNQFSVGINYQHTNLLSDQTFPVQGSVDKTFSNWLPNLSWRKQLNKQTSLRMFYRASVNAPSVNQLQNVINNSNPLFLTAGNPFLDQAYTHFLTARINVTNAAKGKSFFAGMFGQLMQDYITNATWVASKDSIIAKDVVMRRGSQLSKPVNLDGFRSLRGFANYGFPLKPIKSNLNLSGGISYARTPGMVNDVVNYSNNYSYNAGVTIGSNISEFIDFTVSYSGNFNHVINTIQPELNNKFYSHTAGVRVNLLTKNGWFVLNDLNNQIYSGLADGFNQNFWLWNVSVGKKFLKNRRGELKASVFDLLKQNQSVVRNVGETYIEDVQTQVLQQYFMLTFTYTLRNFGTPAPRGGNGQGGMRTLGF
jgi:hypothetical protein